MPVQVSIVSGEQVSTLALQPATQKYYIDIFITVGKYIHVQYSVCGRRMRRAPASAAPVPGWWVGTPVGGVGLVSVSWGPAGGATPAGQSACVT